MGRAEVLTVDPLRPSVEAIERGAEVLRSGGLVAFPTETVYGLGADARSAAAVRRVFAVKGRPADDPLIVHVASVEALGGVAVDVPGTALEMAEAFWPGPLTLVVPRGALIGRVVTAGLDSVAVRSPAHPVALALLVAFDGPIAAPSANPFGRASPTTAAHVVADLGSGVDLVLDGGPCPVGVESTVVDCLADPPRVLRPGGVPIESLARWSVVAGGPVELEAGVPGRSPGMLPAHYAPRARMVVARAGAPGADLARALGLAAAGLAARGRRVALLVAEEDLAALGGLGAGVVVRSLGPLGDPAQVARRLYAVLREADEIGAGLVLARDFGSAGLAAAVRDRLGRAAGGRMVLVAPGAEEAAAREIAGLAAEGR